MQVELLSARAMEENLTRFIAEYDEFYWAVAWGAFTNLAQEFLKHSAKFRSVTFGISFCQTDPDLVDALVGLEHAYVATKFAGGTYHPKVYCFRSGDRAAAIVGSANFTRGGLGNNLEAAVLLIGSANEQVFRSLFDFIRKSTGYGEKATKELAAAYRESFKLASRLPKPPRNPVMNIVKDNITNAIPFASMTWSTYHEQVHSSRLHDFDKRVELLRIAQKWFASVRSFEDLDQARRKAIAGTLGELQKKADEELDRDWGWFGSMKGAGDFANRIDQNDPFLARAIDSIPRQGEVRKVHYERFVENFVRAFDRSVRKGRVPTASRLLAIKRPDTFLCISEPNIVEASRALGFAKTTLTFDSYWGGVVEVIRSSDWYRTERPADDDAELWDYRVAMLDAIFYRP